MTLHRLFSLFACAMALSACAMDTTEGQSGADGAGESSDPANVGQTAQALVVESQGAHGQVGPQNGLPGEPDSLFDFNPMTGEEEVDDPTPEPWHDGGGSGSGSGSKHDD
jgi:hypothetical protein